MLLSYFPVFTCLISRFRPVLDFSFLILSFVLFWTAVFRLCLTFRVSTLDYPIDYLPVTSLTIWITSVITVCWKLDPDYGLSLCHWNSWIVLICPCDYHFCLTTSKTNKDCTSGCLRLVPNPAVLINAHRIKQILCQERLMFYKKYIFSDAYI